MVTIHRLVYYILIYLTILTILIVTNPYKQGAALYDLLGREVELREKRQTVLARTLEIQEVLNGAGANADADEQDDGDGDGDGDGDADGDKNQVEAGLRSSAQHVTEETSKVLLFISHKES